MHKFYTDAQAALSFIRAQATYIETEVEKIDYPDVQYPELVPVDYTAPEWVKSVTYTSTDRVGKAQWFAGQARDIPKVDLTRAQYEVPVFMAGVGYGYNTEELAQAQMMGVNLNVEKADAAREAYENFVDDVALQGDTAHGFSGLISYPGITATTVPADGTGSSTLFVNKTPDFILRDINASLTGIWTDTNTIGLADTLLLPLNTWVYLSTTRLNAQIPTTIIEWLKTNNIYTLQTGRPLLIRAVRGLETAGAGSTGRIVAYKRDPKVLKMHIPMRHRFLEVMHTGPLLYDVPGIFRLGGLDVKRPKMIRYIDGVQ